MALKDLLTSNPYETVGTGLYARVGPPFLVQHHKQHARELAECLPSHGQFLDVGSGPGDLLVQLAPLAPSAFLYGLDPATAAIKMSSQKMSRYNIFNVEHVRAGADETPFEDDRFDAMSSIGAYKHMPDRINSLLELKRILKPGGKFFMFELDPTAGRKQLPGRLKLAAPVVLPGLHFFLERISISRSTIRREIEQAGFIILEDSVADYMPLSRFVLTKD